MPPKKDPNAPKRPLTAFMSYSMKRRPELRELNPDWAFGEFGKALGAEWALMSDIAKAPYVQAAERDQGRYRMEMSTYIPPPDYGQYDAPAVGKKHKDPNAPKKNMSAYMFFSNKRRPELKAQHPEWGFGQFGKTIGAEWARMNDMDKAPYTHMAAQDTNRYQMQMASYVAPPMDYGPGPTKKAKKDPNAPKRPVFAFMFFSQARRPQLREQHPDWGFGQFGKTLGAEWGLMNDIARSPYSAQAAADQERYRAEMARYMPGGF